MGLRKVVADLQSLLAGWKSARLNSGRTEEDEGEKMDELTLDAAICSDYERLLKESQRGLVAWRERSEEVSRFGLQGKTCLLCQFTIGLEEVDPPTSVFISPRRELPA